MQKISQDRIAEELAVLALVYPAAMINPEQQLVLAPVWLEDLGHLTEAEFLTAVAEYRKNSTFFPCPADIRKAHETIISREPEKPKLLAITQGNRPADHDQTSRVTALVRQIKRDNPAMSFMEASNLARKRVREESAA